MATTPDVELESPVAEETEPEWLTGEVTLIYSEEAGTQIIQRQDSLTDYCSMTSDSALSSELQGLDRSSSGALSSLASSISMPLSTDYEETDRTPDLKPGTLTESDQPDHPETDTAETETCVKPTLPSLQAFNVLTVNGTLWIPR